MTNYELNKCFLNLYLEKTKKKKKIFEKILIKKFN